jgi:Holliday junction resolvase
MSKNIDSILEFGEFSKKRRVNSKRKGSNFERKIAKILNERFETKEFSRTPGSGAFATTHKNLPENLRIQGDLITPTTFPFVVECKNGYDVQLDDLFKRKSDFKSFIAQAQNDASHAGKEWMVIYQKTRRMAIVIVGKPYSIKPELVLDGLYFIYPLNEFLKLSNEVFGFHS